MARALISVNGVDGSNDSVPINTLVQLDNDGNGGESVWLWAITDQPAGTTDALSATNIHNPTFTPKKEGTYRITLTVNGAFTNAVIVAVRFLKSFTRIPAFGETTENGARGWDGAVTDLLTLVDSRLNRPMVGAAVATGAFTAGQVVQLDGAAIIKAGLPGSEALPNATLAAAGDARTEHMRLGVIIGAAAGGSIVNGTVILVQLVGVTQGVFTMTPGASNPAVGDAVYLDSVAGGMVLVPPTVGARRVGHVAAATFAITWSVRVFFDAPPSPLRSVLTGQDSVPANNATFYQFFVPFPMLLKQNLPACQGICVTAPSAGVTVQLKKAASVIATISIDNAGNVTFTSAADELLTPGALNYFLFVSGNANGMNGLKLWLNEG